MERSAHKTAKLTGLIVTVVVIAVLVILIGSHVRLHLRKVSRLRRMRARMQQAPASKRRAGDAGTGIDCKAADGTER